MKYLVCTLVLCLSLAAMPQAGAQSGPASMFDNMGLGLRYWNPSLSGTVSSNPAPLDYRDLGLEGKSMLSVFPFWTTEGQWRVGIDLFEFDSKTPFAGSQLAIRSAKIAYMPGYSVKESDSYSWIWGAKLYRHKMKISTLTSEQTYSGVSPVAGFRLDKGRTSPTAWYVEVSGIPGRQYILDAEAGVVQRAFPNTTLTFGYRTSLQRTGDKSEQLTYRLAGPFAQMKHLF